MPNSSSQRLENCFMPPKKFAWRFDNFKNSVTSASQELLKIPNSSSPVKQFQYSMGLLPENGINSSPPVQQGSAMEPLSPAKQPESEDTPLDFSVKHETPGSRQERIKSPSTSASNGLGPHPVMNYSECLKRLQSRSSMAFPGMSNGIMGHSSLYDGSEELRRHEFSPCNGNQKAVDMDCSDMSMNHLNGSLRINVNGETIPRHSPHHSRESSPEKESSILQGMLTAPQNLTVNGVTSKMKEIHINTSEAFQRSCTGDRISPNHPITPVLMSPNQQVAPGLISPVNNIVSPMPFFGGMGYVGPTVSPMSAAMLGGQTPDSLMLHAMASRRQKKRKSGERPFKSYTFDVLQEKLQTNAFTFGLDYSKQLMARSFMSPRSPPSDDQNEAGPSGLVPNGKSYPMADGSSAPQENAINEPKESTEYAKEAISQNNPCPTNRMDTKPNITHHQPNGTPHHQPNGTPHHQPNGVPHLQTNGTHHQTNVSGDSNDSLPCASPEAADDQNGLGRKRKTTNEAEKDDAYWDRRRKNNLAAKRSREARRRKEDAIANMAVMFEAQCLDLKNHLTAVNFSFNDLSVQFNRLRQEHEALKIQNNILQERLSQKRCGQCGAKLPNIN